MNKSLYSLMLMDDVVDAIDRIAMRENTSRSNLVNQILAEYVSMMTPEKRIGEICRRIEEMIAGSNELIAVTAARNGTVSVKSSLNYKYRPTVRYEVTFYREPVEYLGELNIILRTQSETLIAVMTDFFRLLKRLEDAYIREKVGNIRYELYDGRFVRTIAVSRSAEVNIGDEISKYVEMVDDLMKNYVSRGCSPAELEQMYVRYLSQGIGII